MTYRSHDVAIVGTGAAGLGAALVLARVRRRVVILDAGNPRNATAAHMQNFLSRDGMPPADLLAAGRDEVLRSGAEIVSATAVGVEVTPTGFNVALDHGSALTARRLLVATEPADELPDLPGVRERWGRDVLHYPYCHGDEVRDRPPPIGYTGPRCDVARASNAVGASASQCATISGGSCRASTTWAMVAAVIGSAESTRASS